MTLNNSLNKRFSPAKSTLLFSLMSTIIISSCSNDTELTNTAQPTQASNQAQTKLNSSSFIKSNPNSLLNKLKSKYKNTNKSAIKTFSTEIPTLPVNTDFKYESKQWHLRQTNVYDAWKYTQGNKDLIVAVIDGGVDYNHPDLADHVIKGPDFADNDADPMDVGGHGTHVAGIIAGNGNVKGIAPNVKIMALKVFSDKDGGTTNALMASAIRYAVKNGASIINMSIGVSTLQKSGDGKDFDSAVNEATANGVNITTSGGNSGYSSVNKSNINEIPVIATDEMDHLASFSNYSNQDLPKAIAAPGQNIFSTVLTSKCQGTPACDKSYDYKSGTSMAAPFVAGTLALIKSAMYDDYLRVVKASGSPTLSFHDFFHSKQNLATSQLGLSITPSMLAEAIMSSCTNKDNRQDVYSMVYEAQRDAVFGYGRVDVGAATKA
ncbi:MAG: S8 family serine peptidase, partial [Candidatus Sericytochromatia bacterium]|nr:S8 family serine peptidase [Candidatus Sericytochromatia bacterium]